MTGATDLYDPVVLRHGFRWLGHGGGVTEVVALHPSYRAGYPKWNHQYKAWPVTTYLTLEQELLRFVDRYAGDRMVCYGLNPRPAPLLQETGKPRSAKESDIMVGQNLLLDLDAHDGRAPPFDEIVSRASDYVRSLGLRRPLESRTGRGLHLLFAY
jgi:hypothetical protein